MKQIKRATRSSGLRFVMSNVMIASLLLNSVPAAARNALDAPASRPPMLSDFVPNVPGFDPNAPLPVDQKPGSLPPSLLALAKERARQAVNAPVAFKNILHRKVKAYFTGNPVQGSAAPADRRAQLLADAIVVFREFESGDRTNEFEGFPEQKLAPFIAALNADLIANPIRQGALTEPIGEWTVESLVVRQMVGFLGRFKDFPKRALDLISGKHLKGATSIAGVIVTWTLLHQLFPTATLGTTFAIANAIWFAIMAGPIATVTTTAAGFFVRPTTQLVKVIGARLTGDLEQKTDQIYDKFIAKFFSGGDPERNESLKIATFDELQTDFAGMTPADQLKNWANGLNMFIVVQNIFGRLLRENHHGGRDLMMLAWTDSQNVSQLVELLDTKEHVLQGLQMSILAPYRNAFVNKGDMNAKNELNKRVRTFDQLTEQIWLNPDMDQAQVDALAIQVQASMHALQEYGLDEHEMKSLLDIQRKRGQSIGKLITAVAIGHLRSFYGAERNRNLADDARKIALAIQVGLGTEGYTERYLPLVRRQMRLMGQELNNPDQASAITDAATIKQEQCLVRELRKSLTVPAGASAETYACVNALVGSHSNVDLLADPASPSAQFLHRLRSQAARMEASGVMKYAATMAKTPASMQDGVRSALAHCN